MLQRGTPFPQGRLRLMRVCSACERALGVVPSKHRGMQIHKHHFTLRALLAGLWSRSYATARLQHLQSLAAKLCRITSYERLHVKHAAHFNISSRLASRRPQLGYSDGWSSSMSRVQNSASSSPRKMQPRAAVFMTKARVTEHVCTWECKKQPRQGAATVVPVSSRCKSGLTTAGPASYVELTSPTETATTAARCLGGPIDPET